jgi:hypothetical protein
VSKSNGKPRGRPFEPGKSGNPGGRPALPADLKEAQALTRQEFMRVINKYLQMSPAELVAVLKNPATPALHLMVITIIMAAVDKADPIRAEFILIRVLGKAPNAAEVEDPEEARAPKPAEVPAMTREMAEQLLKQRTGSDGTRSDS